MENWSFLQHPNLSVTLVGLGISITVGYFCVKFTLTDRPPSHNSTSILVSAWMLMLTNLEFSKKICMQNRLPDSMMFPCLVCSLWQALESQKQENTGQKCRNHYMFFPSQEVSHRKPCHRAHRQLAEKDATHIGPGGPYGRQGLLVS